MEKQTKEESSRVKILVNSCIRKMDRIRMRRSRKSCAAKPRERGRHAVSKFRRAVNMKIAVEKIKMRIKTVKRRRVDEMKSFRLHPV